MLPCLAALVFVSSLTGSASKQLGFTQDRLRRERVPSSRISPAGRSHHDHRQLTAFEKSGVRPARLHDARHTAATLPPVQGVDQRGHGHVRLTSPTMTARYQHVVLELVEEAN